MNVLLQTFPILPVLALSCVLMVGIRMTSNEQETSLGKSVQESLMWGGGVIIFAAIEYLILMLNAHDCFSSQCSLMHSF